MDAIVNLDFQYVIRGIKKCLIRPMNYITHRVEFPEVKSNFESCLNRVTVVVETMVMVNGTVVSTLMHDHNHL